MPSPLVPILSCTAFILISAFFLRWGWRFRSEKIPPTCRKCGYDISQRPPGVERCSECGSDLTTPHAITEIRRRKNWWMIVPAAVVMLLLLIQLTLVIIDFPWTPWFDANAPTSLIIRLAKQNRTTSGDHYRDAWINREGTSPELVKHLLDLQADSKVPWNNRWGELLLRQMLAGGLDTPQRTQFLNAFFGPATFTVRTPLRQGDPIVLHVTWTSRGTTGGALRTFVAASADATATLNPKQYWSIGNNYQDEFRTIDAKDWGGVGLAPGTHKLNVVIGCEILEEMNYSGPNEPYRRVGERIEHRADLNIEVLPASSPIGTPVPAPDQADAVARAVSVHIYHWHDNRAFAQIDLAKMGVDRAFTIYAIIDGQEKKIGPVAAAANESSTSNTVYVPLSIDRAKALNTLTVVLVGNGEPLKSTLTQDKYWPGRIVYPDVPLETWPDYQRNMTRPPAPSTRPYRIELPAPTVR